MSKRTKAAVALVAILVVVMGSAVYGLSSECYPEPGSDGTDQSDCMPKIVHVFSAE